MGVGKFHNILSTQEDYKPEQPLRMIAALHTP